MAKEVKKAVKDIEPKEIKNVYVVKEGDKISEIATKQGISVRKLMALNDLKSFDVKPGTELTVRA